MLLLAAASGAERCRAQTNLVVVSTNGFDLDGDGVLDLQIVRTLSVSPPPGGTGVVPVTLYTDSFAATGLNGAELRTGTNALSDGSLIGSGLDPGASWADAPAALDLGGLDLTVYRYTDPLTGAPVERAVSTPLPSSEFPPIAGADPAAGWAGIRLRSGTGWRYGWTKLVASTLSLTNMLWSPETSAINPWPDLPATVGEPARPPLTLGITNGTATLSWPLVITNYQLLTATNLAAPVWTPLPAGSNNTASLPSQSPQAYFRLAPR